MTPTEFAVLHDDLTDAMTRAVEALEDAGHALCSLGEPTKAIDETVAVMRAALRQMRGVAP